MARLSHIELARKYPQQQDVGENAEDWAPQLWELLELNVPFQPDLTPLRSDELPKLIRERLLNYVMARLVVAGCQAIVGSSSEDQAYEKLTYTVEDVLDVDDAVRDKIVWFLKQICSRVNRNGATLSPGHTRRIRTFATENAHRCYLCGSFLDYPAAKYGNDGEANIDEKRKARSFEIEHIWPQARGGSKSTENLAASCRDCNKAKGELLSFADFPVEQYIGLASSHDSVKTIVSKPVRVALQWKQKGACAICTNMLYDQPNDFRFIVRREPSQPYHFFNIMICCENCNSSRRLNGVQIN